MGNTDTEITKEYAGATGRIVARLERLRLDDERGAQGLPRETAPADAAREREQLVREFEYLDNRAASEMGEWLDVSRGMVARARAKPHLDENARMTDLLQADILARQGLSADDLAARADAALAGGDTRTAAVAINAAKLAAGGKPVRGVTQLEQRLEEALDATVPHRVDALRVYRQDRLVYAKHAVERLQVRQLVGLLTNDRSAAARAGAMAKLQAWETGKQSGEGYSQRVELASVSREPESGR